MAIHPPPTLACFISPLRLGMGTFLNVMACRHPQGVPYRWPNFYLALPAAQHRAKNKCTMIFPQLIKVLKHFAYIQYGCGMPSMGVCSLNHDTTTSYRLSHTPFFLKLPPPAHVLWRKGVPICPSTASQGAKTLCIQPI